MILRVYAMWNRSRIILCVLLLIYIPGVIMNFVVVGIYMNPVTYLSGEFRAKSESPGRFRTNGSPSSAIFHPVTVLRVLDFSFCYYSGDTAPYLAIYVTIPRQILGVVLFILPVTQALRESIHMYKATKHWQPNKYMALLARDGILDFFLYVSTFFHPPFQRHFPPQSSVCRAPA